MATLKPTAKDGDNDGLVQDSTPFERPEAPKGFIYATDGDNYQTIALSLGAGDNDVLEKAQALHELNNGVVIYPGSLVRVNANA